MFEDVRHEQSLMLLLSFTDPDTIEKIEVTDHELNILKGLASQKLHRQKILKEYFAVQ